MKKYKKYIFIGFLFFLLSIILTFPLQVSARDSLVKFRHQSWHYYKEIYIFGDSLSDTGNVFNATNGLIPPSPTYFHGRFSNGPVWVEYLASDLGLKFNQNTNFAFGGATTGTENIGLATLPGLQQQIESFKLSHIAVNPNSVYILWAGINDYLKYFFNDVPNPADIVANLSIAVKTLAEAGAKNILVVNLPDLGKFPVTGGDKQASDLLRALTKTHNSILNIQLKLLSQALSSDINIILVDVNSLFNRIISNPGEFGLTNVTDSCLSRDLSIVSIGVPNQSVLCIPEQFLFWDQIHPTTITHKLIAELALSLLRSGAVADMLK